MSKNYDKKPCTYILRCSDDTLYTGWTNNIKKRVATHNAGRGGKYTHARAPVELIHVEFFDTKKEAMCREYAIKQLTREEKLKLKSDTINILKS